MTKKRIKVTLRLARDGKEQAIQAPNLVKQTFHLYPDQIEKVQDLSAATGFTYVHCLRELLDKGLRLQASEQAAQEKAAKEKAAKDARS